METCVLLSARKYEFADDKGRPVQGVTLNYLTDDVEQEPDRRGLSPMTINAPLELWHQLGQVPGVYELDFKQRPGLKGRPQLSVVAAKFRAPLDHLLRVAPAAPVAE